MERLNLTGVQAQAILDMRLAKLTKLEIDDLLAEYAKVIELLQYLNEILSSREKLDGVIIDEIKKIKTKYSTKRRTLISDESADVVIDMEEFKTVENCVVVMTRSGGLKRMTPKAYTSGIQSGEPDQRNKPAYIIETDTSSKLLIFTNFGNMFNLPIDAIKEAKYKDPGSPLVSILAGIKKGEKAIYVTTPVPSGELLTVSEGGQIKYTDMSEFDTKKRQISACGLKEKDKLIHASIKDSNSNLLIITAQGMSILISKDEIVKQGKSATGVGGIKLAPKDKVVFAQQLEITGEIVLFTTTGYMKKTYLSDFDIQGRNGKGQKVFIWDKNSVSGEIASAIYTQTPANYTVFMSSGETMSVSGTDIPLEPKASTGMQLVFPEKGDMIKSAFIE